MSDLLNDLNVEIHINRQLDDIDKAAELVDRMKDIASQLKLDSKSRCLTLAPGEDPDDALKVNDVEITVEKVFAC